MKVEYIEKLNNKFDVNITYKENDETETFLHNKYEKTINNYFNKLGDKILNIKKRLFKCEWVTILFDDNIVYQTSIKIKGIDHILKINEKSKM
jgi:hypothetical protein